jgi:hypothetical protein
MKANFIQFFCSKFDRNHRFAKSLIEDNLLLTIELQNVTPTPTQLQATKTWQWSVVYFTTLSQRLGPQTSAASGKLTNDEMQ